MVFSLICLFVWKFCSDTLPAVQDVPDYAPKNFTRCKVAESKFFVDEKKGVIEVDNIEEKKTKRKKIEIREGKRRKTKPDLNTARREEIDDGKQEFSSHLHWFRISPPLTFMCGWSSKEVWRKKSPTFSFPTQLPLPSEDVGAKCCRPGWSRRKSSTPQSPSPRQNSYQMTSPRTGGSPWMQKS